MPEQIDYDSDSSADSDSDSIITNYNFTDESDYDADEVFYDCNDSESEIEDDELIGVNMSHSLIIWALHFGISHTALTALLTILRHFGQKELPKHAKTLLKTPRTRISVRPCPPGEAFYYGIQNTFGNMSDAVFANMDEVLTDFFIDGLSVSESSHWEIWPIMGAFVGRMDLNPYLVHAYAGAGKPKDVDDYLQEFTEEITELQQNGVICGKSRILKPFKIRAFICDSPASAFTSGRIGHGSYHGCPKCDQMCTRDEANTRMVYQTSVGNSRTDESFFYRDDPNHHRPEFLSRHSLLEQAGIGHVSQFALDPLHLIDIGVTKKICIAMVGKLLNLQFQEMQERFLSFRPYVPSELERKPRTLKQVKKFKANEFKQMLNYTLPVLLYGFVEPEVYQAVLLLHVAVRLLQDPHSYRYNLDAANEFIKLFVEAYPDTFGAENFTYNSHVLLHVPDGVEEFGPLYSLSGYPHENHLRVLKGLLRKKNLHLQQLFNRFGEISNARDIEIESNRLEEAFQYNSLILRANHLRDGCCMVKPGIPLEITGLIELNGMKFIRGRRYLRCENFYDYPVASMENQGTILASSLSVVEEDFPLGHQMDKLITKKWIIPIPQKECNPSTSTTPKSTIFSHNPTQIKPTLCLPQSKRVSYAPGLNLHSTNLHPTNIPFKTTSEPTKSDDVVKGRDFDASQPFFPKAPVTATTKLNNSHPPTDASHLNLSSLEPNRNVSQLSSVSSTPSTAISKTSWQASTAIRTYSKFENKAEYRNVNINGKIVALKVMKIMPPTTIGNDVHKKTEESSQSRANQGRSQSNITVAANNRMEVDYRDASNLKLNSFTTKCASFSVLPKPIAVSTGAPCIDIDTAIEMPEFESNGVDNGINAVFDRNHLPEHVPETELTTNRMDDGFNLQVELREIRKKQDETLAFVKCITEREEEHRRALSFPLDDVVKLESLIRGKKFRKKLMEMLRKRTSRTKKDEVVAELISFIFTPDALNQFNVTGIQMKNAKMKRTAFSNLRINQVIKEIANLDSELYEYQLTKAIRKMHMRYNRMLEIAKAGDLAEKDD